MPQTQHTRSAPSANESPRRQRGCPVDTVVVFNADLPKPPNIPAKLVKLLNQYCPDVQTWINDLVIQQCGARDSHHELTIFDQAFDITALVETCAAYRSPDNGAPATSTVEHLVRAEIIRALSASYGDDELADLIQRNITVCTFVGLSLFGDTPSAATLRRFHTWLCDRHPTHFFEHVLDFLNRVDPQDLHATPAYIDAFAMLSPAAAHSPAVMLMRLTASIMILWQTHAPAHLIGILPADMDLERLRTNRTARTTEEEARQIQYVVRDARRIVDTMTPRLQSALSRLLAYLPPPGRHKPPGRYQLPGQHTQLLHSG